MPTRLNQILVRRSKIAPTQASVVWRTGVVSENYSSKVVSFESRALRASLLKLVGVHLLTNNRRLSSVRSKHCL